VRWDRWNAYQKGDWEMHRFVWHTNRLLILLEPDQYYASYYFWQADKNQFLCYYVNFQLPFRRSETGFDTFDLELDIIIEPTYEWRWKDLDEYQKGIECGILRQEWIQEIDAAKQEIFDRLEKRQYTFNGSWLNWLPDRTWSTPKLPEQWDKI
jgi:protein associated with RNAse G/E